MPIINLDLNGKRAIGDGTQIVCMNGDYVVRIKCTDCSYFLGLPIKRLVLKAGHEYQETDINEVTEGSTTYLQAQLPVIEKQSMVEIGVYGKPSEDSAPTYTSSAATFACSKSVLCGTVVLKKEPTLTKLTVTNNGKYTAAGENSDGFYEVNVNVSPKPAETRTVELAMAAGNQIVLPTRDDRTMSQVTINKPAGLIPENIREGISIGGVVGTYDKKLTTIDIRKDGTYTPPEGYDGFSSVFVNTGDSTLTYSITIGQSFDYDYNSGAVVTFSKSGIVKYENDGSKLIFTGAGTGACSITIKDLDASGAVVKTVHCAVNVVLDKRVPLEAANDAAMQTYLEKGLAGSVIKYTGETSIAYIHNALYILE